MRPAFFALLSGSLLACADGAAPDPLDTAMLVSDAPACSDIRRVGAMTLAPAAPDLMYRRCGTVAGENAWAVTLSPDHQRLAALTNVGTVRLVETGSFQEIAELASPIGALSAAAFSPDGARLATLGNDESNQLTIWSARDGTVIDSALVPPSRGSGSKLAFSSDGKLVATSAQSVFDLATSTIKPWSTEPGGPSFVTRQLAFIYGDRQILAYVTVDSGGIEHHSYTNTVWLIDLATGKRTNLHSLGGSFDAKLPYALSDDKRLLAVRGSDASPTAGLRLYADGASEPVAFDPDGVITVLAFSHDGSELYTMKQGELEVREIPSLKPSRRVPWKAGGVLGLSPEGLLVASTSTGMEWRDPKTGEPVRAAPVLSEVTWSADGVLGAGVGAGTLLRVWHETDGEERCRIATPAVTFPTLRPRPPNQPSFATAEEWSRPLDRPLGPWKVSQTEDGTIAFMQRYLYRDMQGYTYGRTVEEVATNRILRRFTPRLSDTSGELSADGSKLITVEGSRYMPLWCR